MFLQDLSPGQKVSIQVDLDGKHFEFPSRVIMAHGNGIYLEPYEYKGSVVDFGAAAPGYLFFHLHFIDSVNNVRQVFRNLNLVTKNFNGMKYYFATVRKMDEMSFSDERRKKSRFPIQGIGEIKLERNSEENVYSGTVNAQLVDISERGIAFLLPPDEKIDKHERFTIRFTDSVMDKDFELTANCSIVRKTKHEDKMLYGCNFSMLSEKMLMYLCFKSIEERAARRESQENANQ